MKIPPFVAGQRLETAVNEKWVSALVREAALWGDLIQVTRYESTAFILRLEKNSDQYLYVLGCEI